MYNMVQVLCAGVERQVGWWTLFNKATKRQRFMCWFNSECSTLLSNKVRTQHQSVLVCPGLSWSVLACPGLSWPVLACPGLSWSVLVPVIAQQMKIWQIFTGSWDVFTQRLFSRLFHDFLLTSAGNSSILLATCFLPVAVGVQTELEIKASDMKHEKWSVTQFKDPFTPWVAF